MREKIKAYTLEFLGFLARKILIYDLILCVLAALSFFVFPKFTFQAYSERLIWTGIGVSLIAGILVTSQTVGGRDFGTSGLFIRQAHTDILVDFNIKARQAIETRMGIFPRIFLIGAICFFVGALVQVLFP